MARREPRVSCINRLKKSNLPKDLIFGLIQTVEREREGERERERESQASLFDSWDFIYRNSAVRELKLIYATRSKVQGSGFHGNREKVVSCEIMSFEVGFFSYLG